MPPVCRSAQRSAEAALVLGSVPGSVGYLAVSGSHDDRCAKPHVGACKESSHGLPLVIVSRRWDGGHQESVPHGRWCCSFLYIAARRAIDWSRHGEENQQGAA